MTIRGVPAGHSVDLRLYCAAGALVRVARAGKALDDAASVSLKGLAQGVYVVCVRVAQKTRVVPVTVTRD
jgi:hypothetical protein